MSNYDKQMNIAKSLGYSTPGKAILELGKKEFLSIVENDGVINMLTDYEKKNLSKDVSVKKRRIQKIDAISTEVSANAQLMINTLNEAATKKFICMGIPKEYFT